MRGGELLDWLWHFRGSVPLPEGVSDEVVIDRVAAALGGQLKPLGDRGHGVIEFNDPMWRSNLFRPNWLTLVIYDRGRVWIDRSEGAPRVRYDFRSLHGLVFCLGATAAFSWLPFMGGGVPDVKFGLFALAWLYGGNLLLAALRVPGWVRRAVGRSVSASAETPSTASRSPSP